jgi:hypothetical protein
VNIPVILPTEVPDAGAPRATLCDPDGIPVFQQYGNPLKDIAKIRSELMKKFLQVRDGNGIVAFWSDNQELEDLEFALQLATCVTMWRASSRRYRSVFCPR